MWCGRRLRLKPGPFFTALIRWTPASPPGHSEQCEPAQPKDAARLSTEQRQPGRSAQMAALCPVQDGSGGDPVVGGGLPVLPSMSRLLGSPVNTLV